MKLKTETCSKCGNDSPIWKRENKQPICQFCANKKSKLKQMTPKTKQKNTARAIKLSIYYDYHISLCRKSEESGIPITNPGRIHVAHLLPKRTYKSVESNLDNFIYLLPQEHLLMDSLLDKLDFVGLKKKFKNSWTIILQRVEKMLPLITEKKKLIFEFEKELL